MAATENQVLELEFWGIDDFNRAVFKGNDGRYYGSTAELFSYDDEEEYVKEVFKKHPELIEYFGRKFGCEPMGSPLKEGTEVIFI